MLRQRRQSLALSKRVYGAIPKLLHQTTIQWRENSFVASVPLDTPKVKKGRKRIPKDERLAMVESFVSKYGENNSGKFPSIYNTRKEVGGSYYVIRFMIQKLKYKSKMSSLDKSNEILRGKEVAKDISLAETKEVSTYRVTTGQEFLKDAQVKNEASLEDNVTKKNKFTEVEEISSCLTMVNTDEAKDNKSSEAEEIASSQLAESDNSLYVSKSLKKEAREDSYMLHEKSMDSLKMEIPSGEMSNFDGPKADDMYQKYSPELEKSARVSSKEQVDNVKQPQSSVWRNLKSLADGIINIWRKL